MKRPPTPRTPNRRKRIIALAVFLLAGTLINIAVAWSCAAWSSVIVLMVLSQDDPPSQHDPASKGPLTGVRMTETRLARGFGIEAYTNYTMVRPRGVTEHEFYDMLERQDVKVQPSAQPLVPLWAPASEYGDADTNELVGGVATGWPLRSLACEYEYQPRSVRDQPDRLQQGFRVTPIRGIAVSDDPIKHALVHFPRALPLRPLWSNFAINTLLYATILYLLIRGPTLLRQYTRLKQGRCPMCAYDLQGAPPGDVGCPECGWGRPEFTIEPVESKQAGAS